MIGNNHNIFHQTLPVSGGKGVTLYEWTTSGFGDPNTGGTVLTKKGLSVIPSTKVWKYFGDRKTQPVYKGEVENGVPNGLGILISPMGGKYVGEWKNGEKNGLGTRTYPVGWEVGEYKDGVLWNGTYYDENGNITEKYVNGKRLDP